MDFSFSEDTRIARVFRESGKIEVNPHVWKTLDEFQRKFILFHEKGHFDLDTRSEFEADLFALNHLKTEHRHFKKSLETLIKILGTEKPHFKQRIKKLLSVIELQDYFLHSNLKIKLPKMKIKADTKIEDLLAVRLNSMGIKSVSELSETEKEQFLINFYQSPEVKELISREVGNSLTQNQFDNMSGDEQDEFLGGLIQGITSIGQKGSGLNNIFGAVNDKISGIIGKGAKALGIKNPSLITGLINPGQLLTGGQKGKNSRAAEAEIEKETQNLQLAQIKQAQADLANQPATQLQYVAGNPAQQQAPTIGAGEPVKAPATDKDKQKKMLIIGGVVLGVIIIGVVLFFVLKPKK